MMARRSNPQSASGRQVAGWVFGWLRFTLGGDTQKLGPLPRVVWNWLLIVGVGIAWWQFATSRWQLLGVVTVALILGSMLRAAIHMPARRKFLTRLVDSTRRPFKHPTSTISKPLDPTTVAPVTRWGGIGKPVQGTMFYGDGSTAANIRTRGGQPEQALAAALPARKNHSWWFDWDTPGQVNYQQLPDTDPRITTQSTRRWIDQVIGDLFRTDDVATLITWPDMSTGTSLNPQQITVEYGASINADTTFRHGVERDFDLRVTRQGIVWLYDWDTPGALVITAASIDSAEAAKKAASRKISDALTAIMARKGGRGADRQINVTVTDWLTDNTPAAITITYGTLDYSAVDLRWALLDQIDKVLHSDYPNRVWLSEWRAGVHGQLLLTAVPLDHPEAQRKEETARLRFVATEGFPRNTLPDVEVTEWSTSDKGRQQPARIVIDYGSADMTNPDTRRLFQNHLDSQTVTNDWRFDWEVPREVTITAVPPLPNYVPFPAVGTPEHDRWNQLFREGKILLGPAKGGYEAMIDLSKSPHALVGGSTGAGKSVMLTMVLYGSLMNPDVCELVVADPKVTDFTWTPGYPNVRMYAVRDIRNSITELRTLTQFAFKELNRRQSLLRQYGVENLQELRRLSEAGLIALDPSDIPKRLIVFFDEGGAAFTPVKDSDLKAEQDAARTDLENIGMLGRAMNVNIVMAAQKPSADNIGTALRAQLVNRICIGAVLSNESLQILGNTLAVGLAGPKGRGVMVDDTGRELVFQTLYLSKRNSPDPVTPEIMLEGVQERVATLLTQHGYQPESFTETMVTEDKEGNETTVTVPLTRWIATGQRTAPAQEPASPPDDADPSKWVKVEVAGPDGLPVPKWVRLDRIDGNPNPSPDQAPQTSQNGAQGAGQDWWDSTPQPSR